MTDGKVPPGGDRSWPLEVLLAGTAGGDRRAFAEIYRRLSPSVTGVVLLLVPRQHEADRVVVDVFVRIWRSAGSFDPRQGLALPWVMAIAQRETLQYVHRYHHVRPEHGAE